MKKLFLFLAAGLVLHSAFAQSLPVAKSEKNDPEAKKLLDKVRKKYEAYKTLEAGFTLSIELPGQAAEVQKGSVGQEGDKFRLEMDQQTIVSDGKTTWVYQKKSKEIQINDADPAAGGDNGFLTPKDLLKRYQKGDFLYAITDKAAEDGKLVTLVEFKPKDRNSEYSKLRVSIDAKNKSIESIKAFAKDGSRYTFKITRLSPDKKFSGDYFTLDPKKYPGARVEDLRM